MTIRSRVRNALFAATTALGVAGIIVVSSLSSPANNLDLDCRMPVVDGGRAPGTGRCTALMLPPVAQCGALTATGGDPPGAGLDAGFPNAAVRVERALEAMRGNDVVDSWHCENATVDGGVRCWCEMSGSIIVTDTGRIDGQAPGWRDALDAQGVGSILVPGRVSVRPSYTKRGACRAHVTFGEEPCAGSSGFDGGPDPDAGP